MIYNINYTEQLGGNSTSVIITRGHKAQDIAYNYKEYSSGILIAGNAGRPGGFVGMPDGSGLGISQTDLLSKEWGTQEEDVVASWLKAEHKMTKKVMHSIFRNNLGSNVTNNSQYIINGIPTYNMNEKGQPWGMLKPKKLDSIKTIQQWNYTDAIRIINKGKTGQEKGYNFSYMLPNKSMYNKLENDIFTTNLVFVFGPNIASGRDIGNGDINEVDKYKSKYNTSGRTKVQGYEFEKHYDFFEKSVKMAFRAGLQNMAKNNINIAILSAVSGGIYSKIEEKIETNININKNYENIINDILKEDYNGKNLGTYFELVLLAKYNPKKPEKSELPKIETAKKSSKLPAIGTSDYKIIYDDIAKSNHLVHIYIAKYQDKTQNKILNDYLKKAGKTEIKPDPKNPYFFKKSSKSITILPHH